MEIVCCGPKQLCQVNVSLMRESARSSARREDPDPTQSGSRFRRMNRQRAAVQREANRRAEAGGGRATMK